MFSIDSDLSAISDGTWTSWRGSKFKIAHISNIRFQRVLAKLQQPFRIKLEKGTLDPKTNRDLVCQAMAEAVLIDWSDVTNSKKESVPYSTEAALQAMQHDPEFRDFVSEFASNIANYRADEVEDMGNGS